MIATVSAAKEIVMTISIYDIKNLEEISITTSFGDTVIQRLPGGWVFITKAEVHPYRFSSVFVPYNNEFKIGDKNAN